IVAGAPGLDWTGRASQAVRIAKALEQPEARLTAAQAQLVHRAVLDACDATDGVKDGVIDNPPACRFEPAVLECKGGNGDGSCRTSAQVATVRSICSPMVNPKTRREIGGLVPGSELGWTDRGWTASARATGLDQFRFLVLNDPAWQLSMFEGDRDAARAEEMDRDTINALDPNLKPFIDRGAKLIQYHGWSDPQISPLASTQYYKRVADTIGSPAAVERAYRLFMVPGMAHCGGGDGPNTFDMLAALEQWVEQRTPPDRIVASHATGRAVDRTRPLCPYPQVAIYKGTGSTNDAASLACGTREMAKRPATLFVCQECGSQTAKWVGRCGDCGAWNSLVEEREANVSAASGHRYALAGAGGAARLYSEIEIAQHARLTTGIDEFDRVLGGGVVPGSLVLLSGEPGMRKSTLLLHPAGNLAPGGLVP